MSPNFTPWDIYVDERKVVGSYRLGFLAIPNTPSFMQKLFLCRHHSVNAAGKTMETREIHWSELKSGGLLPVAKKWIDCVFQHRGAKFHLYPWANREKKEMAVLRFLSKFRRWKDLTPPYNIVVFLDYDSSHARANIQNTIRDVGNVARCYHLDSLKNDCIQCCDLMLGAAYKISSDPLIKADFEALNAKFMQGLRLRDSETKRYIAGYLAKCLDENPRKVYYHPGTI